MQISQSALFRLCCASFLVGLLLAFFYDFLYMTRLWLIPSNRRYTVPLIQKFRAPRIKDGKSKKRKGLQTAIFFGDIIFCFSGALAIILLLYWLNNGAFRAAAPLCIALSFGLWRMSVSNGVRIAFEWLAFSIETVIYTLLSPIKRLLGLVAKTYQKNAQIQREKRLAKQRNNYTKLVLLNVDRAAEKLLLIDVKAKMQKGESRAKQSKKAV